MLLPVLTAVLAVWFSLLGAGKVLGTGAMAERADHVRFSLGAYRAIGFLELAGVMGLLLGLVVPALGAAAAAGFLVLLAGAVAVHLRAGDRLPALAPAILSAVAVAAYLIASF